MNKIEKIVILTFFVCMSSTIFTESAREEKIEQIHKEMEQRRAQAQQMRAEAEQRQMQAEQKEARAKQMQFEADQKKLLEQKKLTAERAEKAKEKAAEQKKARAKEKAHKEKLDKECQILFYDEKTKELIGVMRDLKDVEGSGSTTDSTEKGSKSHDFVVMHNGVKRHLDGVCHHPAGDKDKSGKSQKGECRSTNVWRYVYCPQEKKSSSSAKTSAGTK